MIFALSAVVTAMPVSTKNRRIVARNQCPSQDSRSGARRVLVLPHEPTRAKLVFPVKFADAEERPVSTVHAKAATPAARPGNALTAPKPRRDAAFHRERSQVLHQGVDATEPGNARLGRKRFECLERHCIRRRKGPDGGPPQGGEAAATAERAADVLSEDPNVRALAAA